LDPNGEYFDGIACDETAPLGNFSIPPDGVAAPLLILMAVLAEEAEAERRLGIPTVSGSAYHLVRAGPVPKKFMYACPRLDEEDDDSTTTGRGLVPKGEYDFGGGAECSVPSVASSVRAGPDVVTNGCDPVDTCADLVAGFTAAASDDDSEVRYDPDDGPPSTTFLGLTPKPAYDAAAACLVGAIEGPVKKAM
jgi:hypothetical protein